jgi:ribosomal protein S18 acetylase RimI-like enzyme
MRVQPATSTDLQAIHEAYAAGRRTQRDAGFEAWPVFTDATILGEIAAGHLVLVIEGGSVAGVFSVAYEDPAIWGELERGAHIYLHRIARAPGYRGRGLVEAVLAWARQRCAELGRSGFRIDTWAGNAPLIAYYERLGFRLIDVRRMPADPRLMPHYHGLELALLERPSGAVPE